MRGRPGGRADDARTAATRGAEPSDRSIAPHARRGEPRRRGRYRGTGSAKRCPFRVPPPYHCPAMTSPPPGTARPAGTCWSPSWWPRWWRPAPSSSPPRPAPGRASAPRAVPAPDDQGPGGRARLVRGPGRLLHLRAGHPHPARPGHHPVGAGGLSPLVGELSVTHRPGPRPPAGRRQLWRCHHRRPGRGPRGPASRPSCRPSNASTALVTVGIGGNDLGFSTIATNCASYTPWGPTRVGWSCQCALHGRRGGPAGRRRRDGRGQGGRRPGRGPPTCPRGQGVRVGYPDIVPPTGPGCWPTLPVPGRRPRLPEGRGVRARRGPGQRGG